MCTYRENGIQNPYVVDLPTLVRFLVFVFFLLLLLFILSWTIEVSLQRFTSTALIFQIECLDDLIFWSVCDECTIYLPSISTPQCYVQRQCRQLQEACHYSWSSPHTRPWCGILVWPIKSPWTWHPTHEHKALCRSDQSPQYSAKHNTTTFRTWKAKLTPILSKLYSKIFVYNIYFISISGAVFDGATKRLVLNIERAKNH